MRLLRKGENVLFVGRMRIRDKSTCLDFCMVFWFESSFVPDIRRLLVHQMGGGRESVFSPSRDMKREIIQICKVRLGDAIPNNIKSLIKAQGIMFLCFGQ